MHYRPGHMFQIISRMFWRVLNFDTDKISCIIDRDTFRMISRMFRRVLNFDTDFLIFSFINLNSAIQFNVNSLTQKSFVAAMKFGDLGDDEGNYENKHLSSDQISLTHFFYGNKPHYNQTETVFHRPRVTYSQFWRSMIK